MFDKLKCNFTKFNYCMSHLNLGYMLIIRRCNKVKVLIINENKTGDTLIHTNLARNNIDILNI